MIREAVTHVVPPDLLAEGPGGSGSSAIKIDTIPDDARVSVPLRKGVGSDPRLGLSWWLPAGIAGGITAGLALAASALGMRVLATRRPTPRTRQTSAPSSSPHLGRYRSDPAVEPGSGHGSPHQKGPPHGHGHGHDHGPGAAERVRELIRLNPEAAASVLNRWIGQGEALG